MEGHISGKQDHETEYSPTGQRPLTNCVGQIQLQSSGRQPETFTEQCKPKELGNQIKMTDVVNEQNDRPFQPPRLRTRLAL